ARQRRSSARLHPATRTPTASARERASHGRSPPSADSRRPPLRPTPHGPRPEASQYTPGSSTGLTSRPGLGATRKTPGRNGRAVLSRRQTLYSGGQSWLGSPAADATSTTGG